MKKPILAILALLLFVGSTFSQNDCTLEGPPIVCKGERVSIQFDTEAVFTNIKIDAFTVVNSVQLLALQENITNNSADIIFLVGGDAEIIVKYFDEAGQIAFCRLNVFVFDEEPIPALGMLSNFVEDQITCESLDLSFESFILCPDCPFYWTLNDEIIEIEQQVSQDSILQTINARLQVEGVGSYTFCHHILKKDSSCFVKDCIDINIVELEVSPSFSLDVEESIFCSGSTLHFTNETNTDEAVRYIWEIKYDSLQWRYSGEELDFKFLFPGTYEVSLQYHVVGDENCISDKTTYIVDISDAPLIPITCSSNSCKDSIFTYQAPIDCEDYEWIIDESLGDIISIENSGITIKWAEVDKYTETRIKLFLGSCNEDACDETFRDIILFPSEIIIEGPRGICDRGTKWYEADFIPNAVYTWEIEMIDSLSGIAPEITKIENNRVRITYNTFIGDLSIKVKAALPSKDCEVSGEFISTSLRILTNDNLCPGDLFKASILPNIDQEVVWTLTNESTGYFKEQTLPSQNDFFAFDLNVAGDYVLNVVVPELDFTCGEEIPLTILELPEVNLLGPLFICPGDSVTYTLAGLGANDHVEWTIFQNNTSTDLEGNEIKVLWIEGGEPYTIKVSRSTEVMADQICDSDNFIFSVVDIENQVYEIIGPEVVCYDGQGEYHITNSVGEIIWEFDPPYMGTIIQGDSTEMITVQWHYAPNIPFATLSTNREVCDSLYKTDIEVYFEPFVPELIAPDSTCLGEQVLVEVLGLESYQTIAFYLNDTLVQEDDINHFYIFRNSGYSEIKVEIVNPNGCPGLSTITKQIYVIPQVLFSLISDSSIKQCPKESFEDVTVEVNLQNAEAYYTWRLDDVIVQEGLGSENIYSYIITNEMIDTGAAGLMLTISVPDLCPSTVNLPLDYGCEELTCQCIEPISAQVDYLTLHECNLASFGGSIDFSTVIDPYWSIALLDTFIIIPITGPEDLVQDSFYFSEESNLGQVALRGTCVGVTILNTCEGTTITSEVIDTTLCSVFIDEITEKLYSPDFVREYICNEDLTYDIIFTERSLRNSNPPFNSTVSWIINGVNYEGISILVEDMPGGTPLTIEMTQCSLDGTYCCSNVYETTVRKEFSPNIILPNGSFENDLWLFTLDVNQNDIESVLWDFGDGSGSTLLLTEKGFLDTLAHNVSAIVTDNLGCVAEVGITVESFPNLIDGEILFESDPCAPSVSLTYLENSESMIVNYNWDTNNPIDSSTILVTNSGNYSVTVTDNHGCTDVASVQEIMVNESFANGLRFNPENCGVAAASIVVNSEYTYTWFVDGELVNVGNSLIITMPGEHEIKVISSSVSTNEICDSIVEHLIIHPSPQVPLILEEKVFCDPFILELSLQNYPSALWSSSVDLQQEAASILVSQNGVYNAAIIDENGCRASINRTISEKEIPFDQLLDLCIQACREDLDSLQINIPAINESYSSWTWVTVDTFGIEYEVAVSSGFVTPLTITSDMYDYVQLQVTQDDCTLRSERIPLDIQICAQPEPPVEIICEPIDSDHASCGQSIYKCLLSEVNGGPKLYFEGSIILPMGSFLCSEDTLSISLNNGQIVITDLLIEEDNGKIMVFYSANIIIEDADDYQENGTVIKFDFCNEDGELAYCYEYTLPYRTCNKDFSCLIDYKGITSGENQTVDINYCLNLSEVIQDDCTLSEYKIRAIISGDINVKTIYTKTLDGDFSDLHCISIQVSQEDFYGGEYQCIELMIEGDCPGIKCSEYQCGIFGNSNMMSNNDSAERKSADDLNVDNQVENIEERIEESTESFMIYPNPSTGLVTIEFTENLTGDLVVLKDVQGKTISNIQVRDSNKIILDLGNEDSGLYTAIWMRDGRIVESKILILIR